MTNKSSIAVLCGGQSTEHEISLLSANNIVAALDQEKYDINVIYIAQDGSWHLLQDTAQFLAQGPQSMLENKLADPVTVVFGAKKGVLTSLKVAKQLYRFDCIFPALHGTFGEDGVIQGVIEALGIPYVGANVLSSAICMDKDITKQILLAANIPVTPWLAITQSEIHPLLYQEVIKKFGNTVFIKPASLGSSVGVSRVCNQNGFNTAIENAFKFDERILIEPAIEGREIECSVLGNGKPVASLPGEIVSHTAFYSYSAKYLEDNAASTEAPADISQEITDRVRDISTKAFHALRCSGLARVDFFVTNKNEILINEINTMPGFTNISMYPKMWEVTGIPYSDLLDQLIKLAQHKHTQQQKLCRQYINTPGNSAPMLEERD